MEKSIETIWKEGFLKTNALVAPQLNDLYDQKSGHLVDKMMRMFRLNGIYVIGLAAFLLLISILSGVPVAGIVMVLLFLPLIIYGQQQLKVVKSIDKGASSYQYLKSFDEWLKAAIAGYTRIYRLIYPLFILTLFFGYWFASPTQPITRKLTEKFPDAFYLVNGVPVYWLAGAVVLAVLSAIFAGRIYRWDMNTIYGRVFKKLDEIIYDMEELRS